MVMDAARDFPVWLEADVAVVVADYLQVENHLQITLVHHSTSVCCGNQYSRTGGTVHNSQGK
jgi:hypothetical protein